SLPQKVFSAIWAVESEVNNGGFSVVVQQTAPLPAFPNTSSTVARNLRHSLSSLAASEFPDEVLEKLEALDQEFFSYPHDLTALLFGYVSEHPEEFGVLPKPDDA